MLAERLLSRLDGVRKTGPDRWIARCPAHQDQTPSLSIRDLGDRLLVHDFGGCSTVDVLAVVGLELSALFEATEKHDQPHSERAHFPAADVLRCVAYEATVVAVFAAALADSPKAHQVERERLLTAASRLRQAARIAGVTHD